MGNYFKSVGLSKGDVLAVCLENRVDHTGIWMGLAKIGAVGSLTNTNIRGQSLVHTLDVVKAKGILFSDETELGNLSTRHLCNVPSNFFTLLLLSRE